MTKSLHKAIMITSKLGNNFTRLDTNVPKWMRTATTLFLKPLEKNPKLWQIVKPLFSYKVKTKITIPFIFIHLENNEMIGDEIEISKLINKHFKNTKTYKREKCSFHRNSLSVNKIPITNRKNLVILHSATIPLRTRKQYKRLKSWSRKVSQKKPQKTPESPVKIVKENTHCNVLPFSYGEVIPIHKRW